MSDSPKTLGEVQYSFSVVDGRNGRNGPHYRIQDQHDNAISFCYLAEHAQAIVDALNFADAAKKAGIKPDAPSLLATTTPLIQAAIILADAIHAQQEIIAEMSEKAGTFQVLTLGDSDDAREKVAHVYAIYRAIRDKGKELT